MNEVRRSTGLSIMAALIALSGVAGAVSVLIQPPAWVAIRIPTTTKLLFLATGLVSLWAAWAIWRARWWAVAAYLTWCAVGLVAAVHYQVAVVPQLLAFASDVLGAPVPFALPLVAVIAGFGFHVALLAAGWWYLRTQLAAPLVSTGAGSSE